ncbi:MAG TPA: hypothetical protein VGI19_04295 [Candidatus Cybelea sp.]
MKLSIAVVMMLLALAAPTRLSIQPWTGAEFQTTSSAAAKYRLEVSGKPKAFVRLQARGVASGWLAAFCTPKYCAPQRVETSLPSSGQAVFQFELIRESSTAPKETGATIVGPDGSSVSVPLAHRE